MIKAVFNWLFDTRKPTYNTLMEKYDMARIVKNTDGSGTLYLDGQPVQTYARYRDAKRGAVRRGLLVA